MYRVRYLVEIEDRGDCRFIIIENRREYGK